MDTITATDIAAAFNGANDKRHWSAKALTATNIEMVVFDQKGGMVNLIYYVAQNRFAVKFNKFHASWGDYVKAIARALYVVLNTLKGSGFPMDAPNRLAGMVIEAVSTDDTTTYVSWKDPDAAAMDYAADQAAYYAIATKDADDTEISVDSYGTELVQDGLSDQGVNDATA